MFYSHKFFSARQSTERQKEKVGVEKEKRPLWWKENVSKFLRYLCHR